MDPFARPTGPQVTGNPSLEIADPPVEALLELLGTRGAAPAEDRRRVWRRRCRARGSIRIVGITPANKAEPIFLCDANNWGIGFFSRSSGPIPSNAEATVTIVWPDGRILGADGYILRSREVYEGWRHSAFLFLPPQPILSYII